jgi:hypothetical protein
MGQFASFCCTRSMSLMHLLSDRESEMVHFVFVPQATVSRCTNVHV